MKLGQKGGLVAVLNTLDRTDDCWIRLDDRCSGELVPGIRCSIPQQDLCWTGRGNTMIRWPGNTTILCWPNWAHNDLKQYKGTQLCYVNLVWLLQHQCTNEGIQLYYVNLIVYSAQSRTLFSADNHWNDLHFSWSKARARRSWIMSTGDVAWRQWMPTLWCLLMDKTVDLLETQRKLSSRVGRKKHLVQCWKGNGSCPQKLSQELIGYRAAVIKE